MDQFVSLGEVNWSVAFLVTVFASGLLGSLHCAGMCGPLATTVSRSWHENFLYNFGRLIGYGTLGFVLGSIGQSIFEADTTWIKYGGTLLMVLFVITSSFGVVLNRHFRLTKPNLTSWFKWVNKFGPFKRAFSVGLLTTLLPCAWLMVYASVAAASGSKYLGALVMIVFWTSTLPVMTLLPLKSAHWLRSFYKNWPMLSGTILCTLSLLVIALRFSGKSSCH